jgi:diaminopimelate epimerase
MRIFNPDGSEAAMCGNGLRCVAWYLHTQDHGQRSLSIETGAGTLAARIVARERVQIFLAPLKNLRLGLGVAFQGKRVHLHSVNTGVPHAVLVVPDRTRVHVAPLGRFIRFHRLFQPKGTNVDLMEILSPSRIAIRTYERGVEGETLACGTGAVACAAVGAALGKLRYPIDVKTASGEHLQVGKTSRGTLTLEGPARILFEGVLRR